MIFRRFKPHYVQFSTGLILLPVLPMTEAFSATGPTPCDGHPFTGKRDLSLFRPRTRDFEVFLNCYIEKRIKFIWGGIVFEDMSWSWAWACQNDDSDMMIFWPTWKMRARAHPLQNHDVYDPRPLSTAYVASQPPALLLSTHLAVSLPSSGLIMLLLG